MFSLCCVGLCSALIQTDHHVNDANCFLISANVGHISHWWERTTKKSSWPCLMHQLIASQPQQRLPNTRGSMWDIFRSSWWAEKHCFKPLLGGKQYNLHFHSILVKSYGILWGKYYRIANEKKNSTMYFFCGSVLSCSLRNKRIVGFTYREMLAGLYDLSV